MHCLDGSDYTFPATSWNINDLYVTLSLPQVFNYHWEGGSLATMEEGDEVEYTKRFRPPARASICTSSFCRTQRRYELPIRWIWRAVTIALAEKQKK